MASNLISPSEYGLLQVPSYSVSFKLFSSSGLYHQTQPSLIFALHGFLSGLRQTFGAVGEMEFSKNIDFVLKFPPIGRKSSPIGALRVGGTSRLLDGILQMRQSSKLQISAVCFPEADCPVGVGRFSLVKGYRQYHSLLFVYSSSPHFFNSDTDRVFFFTSI